LEVGPDGSGQHDALEVATRPDEVFDRVLVGDPEDVLSDDGAVVEDLAGVVGRRPDDLDPPRVGLVVGAGAEEGGQERVVDVDDPVAVAFDEASLRTCMANRSATSANAGPISSRSRVNPSRLNSTRRKKTSSSGSMCCWARRMLPPWRNTKFDTAATRPGWSGHESRSTAADTGASVAPGVPHPADRGMIPP